MKSGVLLCILVLTSCIKSKENIIHQNKESFTVEEQRIIGSLIKSEILKQDQQIIILNKNEYAGAYRYLETLMKMLLNTTTVELRNSFDWDLNIILDDNQRQAFITPGGHLFISTGLLKFISSESQLVSVIAHEIYYADTGYVVDKLKEKYSDLADLLLNRIDPNFIEELALNMGNLLFEEEEVLKADSYAINLLCPFQYNALGIKTILESAKTYNGFIHWLTARPSSINRINNIVAIAQACGSEEETFSERYQAFIQDELP